MKPKKTWIVIADAATVRVVATDGPSKGLYGVSTKGLKPPAVSVLADAPGLTRPSIGVDRGSISDPDLKGQAVTAFATDIVAFVDNAKSSDRFHDFILIAPPTMLGALRQKLTPTLQDALRADIAKDLTHLQLDRLPDHLTEVLAV